MKQTTLKVPRRKNQEIRLEETKARSLFGILFHENFRVLDVDPIPRYDAARRALFHTRTRDVADPHREDPDGHLIALTHVILMTMYVNRNTTLTMHIIASFKHRLPLPRLRSMSCF